MFYKKKIFIEEKENASTSATSLILKTVDTDRNAFKSRNMEIISADFQSNFKIGIKGMPLLKS